MAIKDILPQLRQERGLTQGDLAGKLFVTRQAVSRWERGETVPGIDMCKLISNVLEVPIARLLEMPEQPACQSCGMPLDDPDEWGFEADGSRTHVYCKHCYVDGGYRYDATMDEMIEHCAPYLSAHTGMPLDEAVSLMGVMLPLLERWRNGD